MTIEDFERAKAIQDKIGIIYGNLMALRHIEDDAYTRPLVRHSYSVDIDDNPRYAMIIDLDFIEMVIGYYEREIRTLEAEFAALGKEKPTNEQNSYMGLGN